MWPFMHRKKATAAVVITSEVASLTWDEFNSEHTLNTEVSHAFINGRQTFSIRVGHFHATPFSILEQIKQHKMFRYSGIHRHQTKLVQLLTAILPTLLPTACMDNGETF